MSLTFTDNVVMINAVTANTTSDGYDISKRSQIAIQFLAANITTGHAVFTVDVSNDGVNWITGVAFQDVTATTSSTWVTSKTLSSNGSAGVYVKAGWKLIRVNCTVTSDGSYSAIMEDAG